MGPQDDPDQPLHSGSRWEPGADATPASGPAGPAAPPRAPRRRRGLRLAAVAVGLAALLGAGALVAGHALDDGGPDAAPASTSQHHGDHDGDGRRGVGDGDRDGDGPGTSTGAPAVPGAVAT